MPCLRFKTKRKMLRIIVWTTLFIYGIIPALVLIFPGIVAFLVYASAFSFYSQDLKRPYDAGTRAARHIDLQINSGHKLGVWHILPRSAINEPVTEDQFSSRLADGSPIFIYLHGKGGTRAYRSRVATYSIIQGQGCHVITFDYRGYADSTGEISEANMVEDALSVFHWVKTYSKSSAVFFWGHSLGSGIAVQAARRLSSTNDSLAGIVLESSFNNLHEVVDNHLLTLPYRLFPHLMNIFHSALRLKDVNFSSDQHIIHVQCPILMLHAEDDAVIPLKLARKLYNTAIATRPQDKPAILLHEFPAKGYGHNFINRAPSLGALVRKFVRYSNHPDLAKQLAPKTSKLFAKDALKNK